MNTVNCAYTKGNKKLNLSFLGSGGEGSVYEIVGYPNRVAKIYHNESDAQRNQREAKIDAMVSISQTFAFKSANLAEDIAWPLSPLYDKNGSFIGFGMNRINAKTELDDLYAYPPKNKSAATLKDRVTCLISLCDVIDRLHQTGQVFGDFNPNNIKIKPDWTVSFVDADSYHVKKSGKEYRCVVCAPGYVAPELIRACKGTSYADCPSVTFTKETDRFALAIHIFRMLMNGCHPFICERHLKQAGSTPAPKSTDKRVENGETPFFKTIPNYVAPQYAPDLKLFPPYLCDLFRKAFVNGHNNPSARPAASEWKKALIRYNTELVNCESNHTHYYWKESKSCPYCAADLRYNKKMAAFSAKGSAPKAPAVDNKALNNTYLPQQAASVVTAAAPIKSKPINSRLFWTITLVITSVMQVIFGFFLPSIYSEVLDNEILVCIGVAGSLIAGFVGTILYNVKWAPGNRRGIYAWWEYLLSVLTALGFTVGFGIAVGLIVLLFMALSYIVIGAIVIAVLLAFISGG